ncbi:MAG: molybdopterin-dependent oxidoreductase [Candidatus Cloacimonadaceae bacterium]|jgi:xanthine dehydrogenase large subunit|nr:molybdopterin-dependent oxidoreductase [Candidatus Cloacimonadota bacterium]MDY0298756.1 molybdopterin-dependent oxidoreductase [Candidatus Cloacimonadaceae bacterium]
MAKLPWHISGKLHVSGRSRFIGDEAPLQGMLYAKFLFSPIAHARIKMLDFSVAKALPGVHAVIGAQDIPGENMIGHVIKDEPLFPETEIMYYFQPLAMVLAEDESIAEAAVSKIKLEYEKLKPVLEIEEADKQKAWYIPERKIECGDVHKALQHSEHVLTGSSFSGGQEHFYMESQRVRAIPEDHDLIHLLCATQSTMEVQEVTAHVLGIPAHRIAVEVPRLGGAFGGKERSATIWGAMAALGAYLTQRPVQVLLSRHEDMRATGKRHPFLSNWKVGFDKNGRINAWDVELLCNGGAYADLSVAILERAMFHADNIYYIPDVRIRGRACITNLPPNTAFRGFGGPQGIYVIESVIEKIAAFLKKDPLEIRMLNAYKNGDLAPYGQKIQEATANKMLSLVANNANYTKMRAEIDSFNAKNQTHKQGIGIMPVKFGISFTTAFLNQGSALIWIYIDGSVSVSTGGVEMGQELNSKIAAVVAKVLGLPFHRIRVESSHTQRTGNASPTAASTGSDINGNAARIAAEKLRHNLETVAKLMIKEQKGYEPSQITFADGYVFSEDMQECKIVFSDLIVRAYQERVALGAYGYYATPDLYFDREIGQGHPFHYYVYGATIARVMVNTLSGEHRLLSTHIVHENGNSLHLEIDKGQVMGAFIQGMGWCTMEELVIDSQGRYLSANPSTYKIPGIRDLPEMLDLRLIASESKEASVFGSKAVGEPPFIYGMAVYFALQDAIRSVKTKVELRFPATPEAITEALC